MGLAIGFFTAVFSTLVWLIYSFLYVRETLGGATLASTSLLEMTSYITVIILPIFALWIFFGQIFTFLNARKFDANLHFLFKQMKKNQDYTDLIARILLETEQGVRDGFVLNKFDLFISDMNELLAEIIYRCNLASNDQIERLWIKVQNGGKWAFGKVFIEVNNTQPYFQKRIFERAQADGILAGTILEFSSRYLNLLTVLEKHDRERMFLSIIETGVFAKVFSIFAPISDDIKKTREVVLKTRVTEKENKQEEELKDNVVTFSEPTFSAPKEKSKRSGLFSKKSEKEEPEKDAFSIALERSFGIEEPVLEAPGIDEVMEKTNQNINLLKKELEEIETSLQATPVSAQTKKAVNDDDFAYPFAGWIDEENYSK